MSAREVTLTVGEDYMAGLLSEELCSDGPLSDLRVNVVTQNEDGGFTIVMEPKEEAEAK